MKKRRSSPLARLGVACAFAGFLCLIIVSGPEPAAPVARIAEQTTPAVDTAAGTTDQRPIYRNSVVPGGVYSDSEAQAAVSRDQVVADHYRPVNLRKLTPVALDRPLQRYVSFRKNGRIYWTSRRMSVERGELVLSDGESLVRARCGNRLSDRKEEPTLPPGAPEPSEDELASITGHTHSPAEPSALPLNVQNQVSPGSSAGSTEAVGGLRPLTASPGSPSPEAVAGVSQSEGGFYAPTAPGGFGGPIPRKPESVTDVSPLTPPPPPPQIPIFVGSLEPTPDPTASIIVSPSATMPQQSAGGGTTSPGGGSTPSSPSSPGTPATPPSGGGSSQPSGPRPPDDMPPTGPSVPSVPGGGTLVPTNPTEDPVKPPPEQPQETPEPGTLGLLGLAFGVLGIQGARRSRFTGSGS